MPKNNFLKLSIPFLILFLIISTIILRAFFVDTLYALSIAAVLSLSLVSIYLYYIITKEMAIRTRAEGRLLSIEKSASLGKLSDSNHDADTATAQLSLQLTEGNRGMAWSEKEKVYFGSAYEVTNSISAQLAMLKKILGCHNCILFDVGEKGLIFIANSSANEDIHYELPNESNGSLLSWVVEHKVPLRIDHIRDKKGINYYTKDNGIESFLSVPVFGKKDELRAILCVDSQEKYTFDHDAERFLVFAGQIISEFMENAANHRRMKIEASEFMAFYRLSKMFASTLKLDKILDIAVTFSKEIVDYDMAIFILKEEPETLKVAAAKGFRAAEMINKTFTADKNIIGWVIKNSKPLLFSDFQGDKRDTPVFPWISLPIRSLICLPLCIKDNTIGVFLIASKKENFFSAYETKIFEVIATHTATQIQNAMMYQQMEKMATTDGLTGLFNHRHFQETLSRELERAERYNERVSLLLIDIDHFKQVNDTYGHPTGDKILKGVAKILVSSIRGVDAAARYGGEEFAVILVNSDGKGALETAERIRKIIENSKFNIGTASIHITSSLGIAVFPGDTGVDDGAQRLLISRADNALYLAKKEGRNKAYLFKDVSDRITNIANQG